MLTLLVYLLWVSFSIYEGKREAFYFSYKMKAGLQLQQVFKLDEHGMFTVTRTFVAAIALIASYNGILNCVLILLALALCFPFFHDGQYYVTRQKLDNIYKKGWFDQSTTSTAQTDKLKLFYPTSRIICFILSLGLITYEIIINWK